MEVYKRGHKVIEIKDIEMRKFQASPGTVAIPENSREFETCDQPHIPYAIKSPDLGSPFDPSRQEIREASVYVYGIVQKYGGFTDIKVFYAESASCVQIGK